MLASLLLIGLSSITGIALVVTLRVHHEKITQLLLGILLGITLFTTLTYLGTAIVPLMVSIAIVSSLMGIVILFLSFRSPWWETLRHDSLDWGALVVSIVMIALLTPIAAKLLFLSDGALKFSIVNAYGDVAWHMANITAFTQGQSFIPENPAFAGHSLNYPFLVNFFSAVLVVTGMPLASSITFPAIMLLPLFFTLLYCLVRDLTQQRLVACLTIVLFLTAGGTFGWIRLGSDWHDSHQPLAQFLLHLPMRDYTGGSADTDGFMFTNPLTSLLLPQRPILFGLPLAMSIVLLLYQYRRSSFLVAGLFAGMVPLFHAHTTLALIPVVISLFLLKPSWQWLYFVIPTSIIGLPEVAYYATIDSETGSFLRWGPGWVSQSVFPLWFWLKNTGLILPLTIVGFFFPAPRALKRIAGAGIVLFVVANLFIFAPWEWDNIKLLVYWLVFTLPLFTWTTVHLGKRNVLLLAPIAALLILIHLPSGLLDIWKVLLPTAPVWSVWESDAVMMGTKIQQTTPPKTVIVNAPIHNSPVFLSGRFSYLGFAAHVWSHGQDPSVREKAVDDFYHGLRYNLPSDFPTYVLIGPDERSKYGFIPVDPTWLIVSQTPTHTLYKIRP